MDVVTNDLAGSSTASIKDYTGTFAYDVATIMLFSSSFALVLAAHNITSRYLFNLGADGIFPRQLGVAHRKHVSPHRASVVISVASLITLLGFIIANVPSGDLYARLAGLFSYAFVMLLVLVALAVGVFLIRDRANRPAQGAAAASLVGFAAMCMVMFFTTQHFTLLTGATGTPKAVLLIVIWGVTFAGVATALVLRTKKPDTYASIGRQ
jgi:amino acid transporter